MKGSRKEKKEFKKLILQFKKRCKVTMSWQNLTWQTIGFLEIDSQDKLTYLNIRLAS
jgi:hypothetical protein